MKESWIHVIRDSANGLKGSRGLGKEIHLYNLPESPIRNFVLNPDKSIHEHLNP